ncbi:hypothetical protein [Balneatrix alpica]|uniref:hypothetical protein n=1 Tax=Balneatrix alpica TaxID=75684 RepID=UPI0027390832|nr:hypothetical protein [Balneatrix alpica]
MDKRALMFLLIAASVLVTLYIEWQKPRLSAEVLQQAGQHLDAEPLIRSYVWNDDRLAVGVVPDQVADPLGFANQLCQRLGIGRIYIDVVDVVKFAATEDWHSLAYVRCQAES